MWYALQCEKGQEEYCLQICKSQINRAILQDAYWLTYEKMRKYEGSWHMEKENLFPGYIILVSDNAEILRQEIESLPIKEKVFRVVSEEEQRFIQNLCGQSKHLAMSKGVIHGGVTRVTEGPLVGREALFRKIDRHKRLVFLFNPDTVLGSDVKVGLEIVEKKE
ncbi:MAG: transcription termination/antitermination NusG family protein [Lachnospiraceae bacterium]|nr:transcription termination/antitermination NusG family protein [Lachnospiraceae bacterium]